MLDLNNLNQFSTLKKDQPLDKTAILDQYREMLERLEHMSHEIEALKRDAAKDMKELETTRFSDEKISRAYEFFILAAEVCDSENYDVTKTFDKFDRNMRERFAPLNKFFEGLKKYALKRDIVINKGASNLDNLSSFDTIYFRVTTKGRDMLINIADSYERYTTHILRNLHDKTAEETALIEAVNDLESLLYQN